MSASERWAAVRPPEWIAGQQDPTTAAAESFEKLKQQLAQEKRNIDGYMKIKERQVIELGERLEEKKRENEQLRTEITAIQKQLKEVTLDLRESTEALASMLNTLPRLSEENGQLKRKVTSLEDELIAAKAQITQYEEDYKRVEANRSSSSWFKSLMTPKESKKVGESKQSTAATQSAAEEELIEEKQILTAQVNAYSRECDKLKKQLVTANEETDSLRKQLEQSCSHADAHVRKLVSDLDTERGKSQALNRKFDEMSERSTRANETLRLKLKTSEIKVKELEEQLNQRSVHSAPVQYTGITQQPQQANDSSYEQYVANNKRQIEETPQVKPQVLLDRGRELPDLTRLQLLEEDSERKRREADKALQKIEETRREQQNQRVNLHVRDIASDDMRRVVTYGPSVNNENISRDLYPEKNVRNMSALLDGTAESSPDTGNSATNQSAVGYARSSIIELPIDGPVNDIMTSCDSVSTDTPRIPSSKRVYSQPEPVDDDPIVQDMLEVQRYAEQVREMSRRPDTAEVELSDEDDSLPYDPNLVCPKCGKRYRMGGVQKLRRHVKEFCTATILV